MDNDPLVLAHARALLTSSAEGATAYATSSGHRGVREEPQRAPANDRHVARQREDVALFFESVTLLGPGVVPVSEWRPAAGDEAAVPTTLWGGVGRK